MLEDLEMCPICGSYATRPRPSSSLLMECDACDNTFNLNWREELVVPEEREQAA